MLKYLTLFFENNNPPPYPRQLLKCFNSYKYTELVLKHKVLKYSQANIIPRTKELFNRQFFRTDNKEKITEK